MDIEYKLIKQIKESTDNKYISKHTWEDTYHTSTSFYSIDYYYKYYNDLSEFDKESAFNSYICTTSSNKVTAEISTQVEYTEILDTNTFKKYFYLLEFKDNKLDSEIKEVTYSGRPSLAFIVN